MKTPYVDVDNYAPAGCMMLIFSVIDLTAFEGTWTDGTTGTMTFNGSAFEHTDLAIAGNGSKGTFVVNSHTLEITFYTTHYTNNGGATWNEATTNNENTSTYRFSGRDTLTIYINNISTTMTRGDNDDDFNNILNSLTKVTPTTSQLSGIGFTLEDWNAIATGAGYQGYWIKDDNYIELIWTDQDRTAFNIKQSDITSRFGGSFYAEREDDFVVIVSLIYNTNYICTIDINKITEEGIPVGTMGISFRVNDR